MNLAHTLLAQEIGVIHGRFQILHNDHLTYLLAGKAECEHLVVGITNPDSSLIRAEEADPERAQPGANPLSFYERMLLVKSALVDVSIPETEFSITPFPINFPDYYFDYLPRKAVFFLTIYDHWGERKLNYFKSLGLTTQVLWETTPKNKGLSAKQIRDAMIMDKP